MSFPGYKRKWPRREYLGPFAQLQHDIAEKLKKSKLGVPVAIFKKSAKPRVMICPRQKRKQIARRSPERRKQEAIYRARVKIWLKLPPNQYCRVIAARIGAGEDLGILAATQVHHVRGRGWRGELLLDERFWLAVSAEGHAWIDANRDRARELGLLAPKNEYNEMPKDL